MSLPSLNSVFSSNFPPPAEVALVVPLTLCLKIIVLSLPLTYLLIILIIKSDHPLYPLLLRSHSDISPMPKYLTTSSILGDDFSVDFSHSFAGYSLKKVLVLANILD